MLHRPTDACPGERLPPGVNTADPPTFFVRVVEILNTSGLTEFDGEVTGQGLVVEEEASDLLA
jgi:hypothetical protein